MPNARQESVSPTTIRDDLRVDLDLDLVGPTTDPTLATETLSTAPSRWYLTGFLAPRDASPTATTDVDQDDELETAERHGADDDEPTERRDWNSKPRVPTVPWRRMR